MVSPRTLYKAAQIAVLLPLGIAVLCQIAIWSIPGCDPNPYATEGCVIFSQEIGAFLVIGLLGGLFYSAILGVFVALPLIVAAFIWSLLRKQTTGKVA